MLFALSSSKLNMELKFYGSKISVGLPITDHSPTLNTVCPTTINGAQKCICREDISNGNGCFIVVLCQPAKLLAINCIRRGKGEKGG